MAPSNSPRASGVSIRAPSGMVFVAISCVVRSSGFSNSPACSTLAAISTSCRSGIAPPAGAAGGRLETQATVPKPISPSAITANMKKRKIIAVPPRTS